MEFSKEGAGVVGNVRLLCCGSNDVVGLDFRRLFNTFVENFLDKRRRSVPSDQTDGRCKPRGHTTSGKRVPPQGLPTRKRFVERFAEIRRNIGARAKPISHNAPVKRTTNRPTL